MHTNSILVAQDLDNLVHIADIVRSEGIIIRCQRNVHRQTWVRERWRKHPTCLLCIADRRLLAGTIHYLRGEIV